MEKISRSVRKDKQVKKEDADCAVHTVRMDADVASPYMMMWQGMTHTWQLTWQALLAGHVDE
jgi:hypothetical protein